MVYFKINKDRVIDTLTVTVVIGYPSSIYKFIIFTLTFVQFLERLGRDKFRETKNLDSIVGETCENILEKLNITL